MVVFVPIAGLNMDFNIPGPYSSANPYFSIEKIGSGIGIGLPTSITSIASPSVLRSEWALNNFCCQM